MISENNDWEGALHWKEQIRVVQNKVASLSRPFAYCYIISVITRSWASEKSVYY